MLYLIAIVFAIFVQARNAEKMVELTKNLQGPPSPEAGAEIAATGKALQRGGMLLTVLIVADRHPHGHQAAVLISRPGLAGRPSPADTVPQPG